MCTNSCPPRLRGPPGFTPLNKFGKTSESGPKVHAWPIRGGRSSPGMLRSDVRRCFPGLSGSGTPRIIGKAVGRCRHGSWRALSSAQLLRARKGNASDDACFPSVHRDGWGRQRERGQPEAWSRRIEPSFALLWES